MASMTPSYIKNVVIYYIAGRFASIWVVFCKPEAFPGDLKLPGQGKMLTLTGFEILSGLKYEVSGMKKDAPRHPSGL
jgi:hypothetical protein